MRDKLIILIVSFLISVTVTAQNITINKGSHSFIIKGEGVHYKDSITIFYHMPVSFTNNSKILLVIPGAGRNADDYCDSWIEASEKYSVLIISPSYPEKNYNYGDYHLGGVVKDLNLTKGVSFKRGTNQIHIDESIIEFTVNRDRGNWIFTDFDRIFNIVKKATRSNQKRYDIFGHSAGGQILHRFVLFNPNSRADRIVASNAGTYTLPDYRTDFPFGLKNTDVKKRQLKRAFRKKLVLFIGEFDNQSETRGLMLRSETADKQGTNRLDRGKNFYKFSNELAKESDFSFNWKLEIIPNVGHNHKKMAKEAAKYLYEQK